MSTQRDRRYLDDILTATNAIAEFAAAQDLESFKLNRLIQSAIAHQLMIIGEAAGRISTELRERHSILPWMEMKGLRNILVHNYFGTDWEEVWRTAVYDVPNLRLRITEVLSLDFPDQESVG